MIEPVSFCLKLCYHEVWILFGGDREKNMMNQKENVLSGKIAGNKKALREGFSAGIPIGLGYFAVSFSLGIAARNAGMTPLQGMLASLLCHASAGQYAGFTMIAASATLLETAIMTFIANARYLLMSCAMSQRTSPKMSNLHRMLMSYFITDELFGVAISKPDYINPWYMYGAILCASPCWALGTLLGGLAGNLLPQRLVSAFSVALYGMFLAIIIPPARKDKVIAVLIAICFAASYLASALPVFAGISSGTRTIILTVAISAAAALLFPKETEAMQEEEA